MSAASRRSTAATPAHAGCACCRSASAWLRWTPKPLQLGIALEPEFRHRGFGRPLMLEALRAAARAGYAKVALTVHPQNPARRMYERCGFRTHALRRTYHLMVANVR